MKGANEARRAEGASRAAGRRSARTRRGEEERDAQLFKLRELAERVGNGAADLVVVQAPAIVRGRSEGGERGERTVARERRERSTARGGHEQAAKWRSARTRRGEKEKDAQIPERRELADGVGDGAGELVVAQVSANVCAAQAVKECEGGSEVSACRNDWTSYLQSKMVRVARSYRKR